LSENESYIKTAVEKGLEGYSRIGQNILVAEGVKIYPTATVEGYAIIGSGSVLRPGAFLRGNVIIGKNCVIGNSTEMKNSVILDGVQIPHYNYVGDSVLGNNSHLGAGAICSNLKNDSKNVVVHADVDYDTGRRKLGAFLADGANVGCGCVLNPGTVIGKNTDVYPMNSLRGVYPENSIVKADGKVVLKSI
jgi:NDP-sugar pyrophosphorylase family protein